MSGILVGAGSVREALAQLLVEARAVTDGTVADYIPELAMAKPDQLSVSMVSVLGHSYDAGETDDTFTIQSISKPFVYALVHAHLGRNALHKRVGFEPSGEPFNAISLDGAGRPANPMINAGAIMVSALVTGATPGERFESIRSGLSGFAGRELGMHDRVYRSESVTGHRNRALASLMLSTGLLPRDVHDATDVYFRQCAIEVTTGDLALMGATLANDGINPVTGDRVVDAQSAQDTLALMSSCGMYDRSGEWGVMVGLPAKSGVSGGIVGVKPGQFAVGTYSPPLDAAGNSVRGVAILERLSQEYGAHLLAHPFAPISPVIELRTDADAGVVLRLQGELDFVAVEQVLHSVDELNVATTVGDRVILDLSAVTLISRVARQLLVAALDRSRNSGLLVRVLDPHDLFVTHR
ncbi:MAG: glutaminase A [Antricoccus sp.]